MWSNTPRVIIRKPPSKELRLLVAKLSPFVKFINIYVKMYMHAMIDARRETKSF